MGSVNIRKRVLCILCILCLAGGAGSMREALQELIPRVEAELAYGKLRREAFKESGNRTEGTGAKARGSQLEDDRSDDRGTPDWTALRESIPDLCGWIYSPGTGIDYPVVQGDDNLWYLRHTAKGKQNNVGAIFMESENKNSYGDDITVLYGHHIRGGRMFSSLSGYKEQKYYEDNPYIYLYTQAAAYRVELFAGNVTDGKTGGFPLQFAGEEDRREWIEKTVRESTFRSGIVPQDGERMLVLCTCSYEYQDARFAVYGVMKKMETAGVAAGQPDIGEDGKENAE